MRSATALSGALALAATMLLGSSVGAHIYHPCPCRHVGGIAQPGETVCLDLYGKRQLARCEMVLNNSSWRFLGAGCGVTAGLPEATG